MRVAILTAIVCVIVYGGWHFLRSPAPHLERHSGSTEVLTLDGAQSPKLSAGKKPPPSSPQPRVGDSWAARFYNTKDYFDFVSKAVKAAYDGDGRAAFFISEALTTCASIIQLAHAEADAEAVFRKNFVDLPLAPQWARDRNQKKFATSYPSEFNSSIPRPPQHHHHHPSSRLP